MSKQRIAAIVVVIVAVVMVVVAMATAGDSKKKTTASSTTSSSAAASTTTVYSGPTAPLTGLPLADDAIRTRPVLTVKVDNHPEARPQFGVDKADVIVEEKVEGGLSRWMALFQSQDSDQVGPVRSLRSTDVHWLKPLGGMIAYSGGIPQVEAMLGPAGITDLGADTHGSAYYKRRSDRPYEHSMYTMTPKLRELTPKGEEAAKPIFKYLKTGEAFGGETAAPLVGISVSMGTSPTSTNFDWLWDPAKGAFLRGTEGKAHELENTGQIAMKNVIVQFTPYVATPWRDRANSVVDEAQVVGSGEAWILSDGKIVKGHWSRPSDNDITVYTDDKGAEVKLEPGQTWLSLVPPGQPTQIR